jgi:hypothetical protein
MQATFPDTKNGLRELSSVDIPNARLKGTGRFVKTTRIAELKPAAHAFMNPMCEARVRCSISVPKLVMDDQRKAPEPEIQSRIDLGSTAGILARIRKGDDEARNHLIIRNMPVLRRWDRGRLPHFTRDLCDTDDIVQETLVRAFNRVMAFDPQRTEAFWDFLGRILQNQIYYQIRA